MTFYADAKAICLFLGINSEDFDQLTVAQIKDTQQKIKETAYEARKNDKELLKDYRFFFKAYDKFVQFFGEELTDKYLPLVPLERLVTTEYIQKGMPMHKGPCRKIGEGSWDFPRTRGPGSRSGVTDRLAADIYKVASDYQGLKHSEIILPILKELTPWISEFKIDVYEMDTYRNGYGEFYVKTEGTSSLYVPYEAFVTGDAETIIKRNEDYLTSWSGQAKGKESFENLMQTPTVQKFLQLVPTISRKEQLQW